MEFDLSWALGIGSDWPPYLKINLMISTSYVRSLLFPPKNAQFHLFFETEPLHQSFLSTFWRCPLHVFVSWKDVSQMELCDKHVFYAVETIVYDSHTEGSRRLVCERRIMALLYMARWMRLVSVDLVLRGTRLLRTLTKCNEG